MKPVPPDKIVFFPVRHHSPACAHALLRGLDAVRPRQVLVEAPVDFAPLLAVLTDPTTRPPVAIVSLPPNKESKDDHYFATYPFCVHSPEFVALRWARENGATNSLIDLPARHPEMRRHFEDKDQPAPLIAEWRLDHNAYVTELCARRGMPDVWALWDALFESQLGTDDWRGFFDAVALYCQHTRETTLAEEMKSDGTLAREDHMAAKLAEAVALGDGPIAVVTGGFHTPALKESLTQVVKAASAKAAPAPNAYIIRYGFRQLDRFNGYGAGLPHPAYYDRRWRSVATQSRDFAAGIITDFAAHLRKNKPALALSTPALSAALVASEQLATLRSLPAPGRNEIIDAVQSAGVKDALEIGQNPLINALHEFLTGDAIGELPPGTAQPPIVEAVRSRARTLAFNLDDAAKRTRDLDILRKPRHAEASRFLFALSLLDTGFAERIAGPDPLTGWRSDVLFETWSYAWSPMVEARLIARAADGQSLEELSLAELSLRHEKLEDLGRAHSAAACTELLVDAVRIGFPRLIERAQEWCNTAIGEDPEPVSIIQSLAVTRGLAKPGPGAPDMAPQFAAMRTQAFERLLFLFPGIAGAAEDQITPLIAAIRELAMLAGDDDVIERSRLIEAIEDLQSRALRPALQGALIAFSHMIGATSEYDAAEKLSAILAGTFVETGMAASVLTGLLQVAPNIVVHNEQILKAADGFLERIEEDAFLAALPELRLAFSQLSPGEIDRIATRVAEHHGLKAEQILDNTFPANEVTANMAVSAKLEAAWRDEGLGEWMEAAP